MQPERVSRLEVTFSFVAFLSVSTMMSSLPVRVSVSFEGEPSVSSVTAMALVKAQNLLSSAKNLFEQDRYAWRRGGLDRMIRIAISQAAFEAIARTLPLGSVGFENATNERGEIYVWLAPTTIDRLRAMRGPGESYSDVILRLVTSADGSGRDQVTEGRVRG
jgi:hypothetical protein